MNRFLACLCAVAALSFGVGAASTAGAASAPGFKEIPWEDLVPKDWDPMKRFRDTKIAAMPEGGQQERDLMREMRRVWDEAPTVKALDGMAVRMPGYVVPLESVKGELKEFLLVPYFGACIHSPPPPANQIVHVVLDKPMKGLRAMDAVWASGTLNTERQDSSMGASGYRMKAASATMYEATKPR